jgi:hypothetical protein
MVGQRHGIPLARNAGGRMHTTITEIAAAEKINESYVGRVLSPLAPDIVMRSWGTAEVS